LSNPDQSSPDKPLDKVLGKVNEIAEKSADGDYIYRGESNKDYDKVSSTLYRQYGAESEYFNYVQTKILQEAKDYTPEKSDDEILTQLQHYGGKTNLIDFTTDFLIALFFACDGHPEKDGRVILLKRDSLQGEIVRPWKPVNRVTSQKSIFVRPPKGFVEPDKEIPIPQAYKQNILEYLERYHGISTKTIYNDLHGFIKRQAKYDRAYTKFYQGLTAYKEKNYEEAIEHYDESIRLNPQFAAAYNNRGAAKVGLGQHKKALGRCGEALKLYREAVEDYDKVIDLNRQDAAAYNNRGAAKAHLGQHNKAIEDYDKAIRLKSHFAEAYNNRGLAKAHLGKHDEAIADYDLAIGFNPQDAEVYKNRGAAEAHLGHYDEAIADFREAIRRNPQYAEAYYNRGIAQLCLGEMEKAKEDLVQAKEKGLDIVALFKEEYGDCEHFDQKSGVKLPDDIKALLELPKEP